MYGALRYKSGFCEEVDKFIEATENHAKAMKGNKDSIICPCRDCKNHLAFKDVMTIRSHLIMRGFVSNYTVWIHYGEMVVDKVAPEEDGVETLGYLDQYVAELGAQMANDYFEQGGGGGGWDDNVEGAGINDGGACVGDEGVDDDDLDDMLRALGPKILLKGKKGLENLERVTKASKETVYDVEKGCPTHWTLLRFVLELLILKAKYGWSDCGFNDLLRLLAWLLPKPNSVPTITYQAKKVINPLTMGVEKSMHARTTAYFSVARRSRD
jgi:hypothetical protein